MELMVSSDNVLRGGLTPKHVDVPELLATLSFHDGRPPVLEGRAASETGREYETPAEEFALERIEIAPGTPYSGGRDHSADCLIVIEGAATGMRSGAAIMRLRRNLAGSGSQASGSSGGPVVSVGYAIRLNPPFA